MKTIQDVKGCSCLDSDLHPWEEVHLTKKKDVLPYEQRMASEMNKRKHHKHKTVKFVK